MVNTLSFGKNGEEQAENYLKSLGYKIIDKNFRSKLGEIDIIAQDHGITVFVEVKTRSSLSYGYPAESLRNKKLKSFIKTSQFYLNFHRNKSGNIRYDVVEVYYLNGRFEINHIKNITL